jgi:hypothetical protein
MRRCPLVQRPTASQEQRQSHQGGPRVEFHGLAAAPGIARGDSSHASVCLTAAIGGWWRLCSRTPWFLGLWWWVDFFWGCCSVDAIDQVDWGGEACSRYHVRDFLVFFQLEKIKTWTYPGASNFYVIIYHPKSFIRSKISLSRQWIS